MKLKNDYTNFAVGPVQISQEIREMGKDPVPYFRTSEFSSLMLESEKLFLELIQADEDSRAIFLTGSGTASMDAVTISLFTEKDRLLILNGGSFGQRFCEIAKVYGIAYDSIDLEWGKTVTLEDLNKFKNKNYTALVVNMGETSSGVLYDMDLIGQFCKENHLLLVVDAISTFISDEINMKEMNADVVITGSQKALALAPGVSIIALSKRAVERIEQNKPRCFYLDLQSALRNGQRGQTPWTPAVGILIQLNARLNQLARDGIENERAKIVKVCYNFRERIKSYPFRITSNKLSNTVTPIAPINKDISAFHLFEILKDEYNIIVCPNGGEYADKVFRVGHIGQLSIEDNNKLFEAFDDLMKRGILHD